MFHATTTNVLICQHIAPAYESGGRAFESLRVRHFIIKLNTMPPALRPAQGSGGCNASIDGASYPESKRKFPPRQSEGQQDQAFTGLASPV